MMKRRCDHPTKKHGQGDSNNIYIARQEWRYVVLPSLQIDSKGNGTTSASNASAQPDCHDEFLLKLAMEYCEETARAYTSTVNLLGCDHLPALPENICEANDWPTISGLCDAVISLAKTLKRWQPKTDQPCACGSVALIKDISRMFEVFTETLSVIHDRAQRSPTSIDQLEQARAALHDQFGTVQASIKELADRATEARALATQTKAQVRALFARAARAGCIHIPAAVTTDPVPAGITAIDDLLRTARSIHANIEMAVYPPNCCSEADNEPQECCGRLTAPVCEALVTLIRDWVHVFYAAWLYASGTHTSDAMSKAAARELDVAAENLRNMRF